MEIRKQGDMSGRLQLSWRFQPPEGSEAASAADSTWVTHPIHNRLTYAVSPWLADGVPTAAVEAPELWYRQKFDDVSPWSSLAYADGIVMQTIGARAFSIDAAGASKEVGAFDSPVSETRTWHVDGERNSRVAVCLP